VTRQPGPRTGIQREMAAGLAPQPVLGSDDAYLSLKRLAGYSSLSVRTLRDYLVHPTRPLGHYRVGGKILVKRSEFDAWIGTFRVDAVNRIDTIVNETLARL